MAGSIIKPLSEFWTIATFVPSARQGSTDWLGERKTYRPYDNEILLCFCSSFRGLWRAAHIICQTLLRGDHNPNCCVNIYEHSVFRGEVVQLMGPGCWGYSTRTKITKTGAWSARTPAPQAWERRMTKRSPSRCSTIHKWNYTGIKPSGSYRSGPCLPFSQQSPHSRRHITT